MFPIQKLLIIFLFICFLGITACSVPNGTSRVKSTGRTNTQTVPLEKITITAEDGGMLYDAQRVMVKYNTPTGDYDSFKFYQKIVPKGQDPAKHPWRELKHFKASEEYPYRIWALYLYAHQNGYYRVDGLNANGQIIATVETSYLR